MSLQPVSALVAAIVSFAIGGSVLLREPRRRAHVLFATLSFNIAAFCLISFFAKRFDSPLFGWLSLVVAVSLPATAQRFFQAFLGDEAGPPPLSRSTVVGAGLLYTALFFSRFIEPLHTTTWFGVAFIAYVFAGLYLSVFYLYKRYRATPSRVEKTRLLYLLVGGFVTVTSMLLEVVPSAPSLGSAFIIVYLYFLSQNLVRYRLLDLNELLGRMVVLGTLVFILSLIYGLLAEKPPLKGAETKSAPYGAKPDEAKKELASILEEQLGPHAEIVDWVHKDDVQREMRRLIKRQLTAAGYTKEKGEAMAKSLVDLLKSRRGR